MSAAAVERYTCANCKQSFEQARPDEQARAEFRKRFGREVDLTIDAVVCDDCMGALREVFPSIPGIPEDEVSE